MVLPENLENGLHNLGVLRAGLADSAEIWVGGAASCYVDPLQFPAGTVHMTGRKDFEHRLDLLIKEG
jgi:hypothetical protein